MDQQSILLFIYWPQRSAKGPIQNAHHTPGGLQYHLGEWAEGCTKIHSNKSYMKNNLSHTRLQTIA